MTPEAKTEALQEAQGILQSIEEASRQWAYNNDPAEDFLRLVAIAANTARAQLETVVADDMGRGSYLHLGGDA